MRSGKPLGDFQLDDKCSDVHLRKIPMIVVWVRTGGGGRWSEADQGGVIICPREIMRAQIRVTTTDMGGAGRMCDVPYS